ncbi:MAG: Crp/Fnr family transcriptional regulator [Prochloraceae cyanobacterium]
MLFTYAEEKQTNKEIKVRFFKKGDEIPLFKQGVWQIEKGIVQLETINSLGERIVLGWFYPKWVLENIGNFKLPHKAVGLSDISLQWYSGKTINNSPLLAKKILIQIINQKRQTEALMTILGTKFVKRRLLQLFVTLRDEIGEKNDIGTVLKIRLTHQNIGDAINVNRATISRSFSELIQDGVIKYDKNRRIILLPKFDYFVSELIDRAK